MSDVSENEEKIKAALQIIVNSIADILDPDSARATVSSIPKKFIITYPRSNRAVSVLNIVSGIVQRNAGDPIDPGTLELKADIISSLNLYIPKTKEFVMCLQSLARIVSELGPEVLLPLNRGINYSAIEKMHSKSFIKHPEDIALPRELGINIIQDYVTQQISAILPGCTCELMPVVLKSKINGGNCARLAFLTFYPGRENTLLEMEENVLLITQLTKLLDDSSYSFDLQVAHPDFPEGVFLICDTNKMCGRIRQNDPHTFSALQRKYSKTFEGNRGL